MKRETKKFVKKVEKKLEASARYYEASTMALFGFNSIQEFRKVQKGEKDLQVGKEYQANLQKVLDFHNKASVYYQEAFNMVCDKLGRGEAEKLFNNDEYIAGRLTEALQERKAFLERIFEAMEAHGQENEN
jgi:hypothetical protein